ncbi:hypothetical protein AVEN_133093-1 [Araneus ventricosus]|uniref:Uncharacterized protein n=1 Tax=Araneus ventricosus TaxID=182803 RepID=A0A4Y2L3L6_ARAVE|nr:hypothetical protein AVEN_133093-1 [Araneus ventricosus]
MLQQHSKYLSHYIGSFRLNLESWYKWQESPLLSAGEVAGASNHQERSSKVAPHTSAFTILVHDLPESYSSTEILEEIVTVD